MPKSGSLTVCVAVLVLVMGLSVVYGGLNQPPVADANGPYSGEVGELITLDGSGSWDPDGDHTIISWEWDLDNDGTHDDASGQTVQHAWSSPGLYVVSLVVTDEAGVTDISETTVTISRASPPTIPLMPEVLLPLAIVGGAAATYLKKKSVP
jgi:hypothetical protein